MKQVYRLWNPQQAQEAIKTDVWRTIKAWLVSGYELTLTVATKTRSTEQNARMWAMLTSISRQKEWYGRYLSTDDWKNMFTSYLKKQDVVPGIEGGFVILGQSTSQMTVAEMTDLMTIMEYFAAQHGLKLFDDDVDQSTGEIVNHE